MKQVRHFYRGFFIVGLIFCSMLFIDYVLPHHKTYTTVDSQMLGKEWHDGMGMHAGKVQTHLLIFTSDNNSMSIRNSHYNTFLSGDSIIYYSSGFSGKKTGIKHIKKEKFFYPALGVYSRLSFGVIALLIICILGLWKSWSDYAISNIFALSLIAFAFSLYLLFKY